MSSTIIEPTLPVGHHLHDYEIRKVLGKGGFGITYHAIHRRLRTEVAIKEFMPREFSSRDVHLQIRPHESWTDQVSHETIFQHGLERFLKEAKALSRFSHPNIIRALNFFEANGTAYIVMDYARGQTLKAWLIARDEAPDEETLKDIFLPLLDGLQEVHKHGLLHRDIKPDNIYIQDNGVPLLLDFGTARSAMGSQTRSLHIVIAEGYSPKEQYATEGDQGTWSDIYALGATLYRSITGKSPASAMNRAEALYNGKPDPLPELTKTYSGHYTHSFLETIDRCLEFNQLNRPQSVADVKQGLMGYRDEFDDISSIHLDAAPVTSMYGQSFDSSSAADADYNYDEYDYDYDESRGLLRAGWRWLWIPGFVLALTGVIAYAIINSGVLTGGTATDQLPPTQSVTINEGTVTSAGGITQDAQYPLGNGWYINISPGGPEDYIDLASAQQLSAELPGEEDCQSFVQPFNSDAGMLDKVSVNGFPAPLFWVKRNNGLLAICKISNSTANIFRASIIRNAPTRADKAIVPRMR